MRLEGAGCERVALLFCGSDGSYVRVYYYLSSETAQLSDETDPHHTYVANIRTMLFNLILCTSSILKCNNTNTNRRKNIFFSHSSPFLAPFSPFYMAPPTCRDVGEMVRDIYSARYMLFMMGSMGVYAGLVYNDYFSLGLNLFGSNYEFLSEESGAKVRTVPPFVCVCCVLCVCFYLIITPSFTVVTVHHDIQFSPSSPYHLPHTYPSPPLQAVLLCPYGDPKCVYPFGADPVWKISANELLFFNSMKMKMYVDDVFILL